MKVSVPERSQVSSFMVKVGLVLFVAGFGLFPPPMAAQENDDCFMCHEDPELVGESPARSIPSSWIRMHTRHRFTRTSPASTAIWIWTASSCLMEKRSRSWTAPCAMTTWPRNSRRVRTGSGLAIRRRRPRLAQAATESTRCSRAKSASAPTAPARSRAVCEMPRQHPQDRFK